MTKIIKKSVSFLLFCCIVFSSAASGYLYRKLGVLSYSPSEKITENFERFKKRIHPNYNSNSEESRERFQELFTQTRMMTMKSQLRGFKSYRKLLKHFQIRSSE